MISLLNLLVIFVEKNIQLIKNSFVSPVSRSDGVDYSDDLVEVYELVDHVEIGPSGEATDFVVKKIPVLTDSYHHNKVIAERVKGTSLKEIIATIQKTGDDSILNSRPVSYGDGTLIPNTLSDACDLAEQGRQILEGASEEEVKKAIEISKMSNDEFNDYVRGLVDARLAQNGEQNQKGDVE